MIKQNFSQAVSLYKEALALTEEHSGDFRLDPLLNIHIHHNLAEILSMATECSSQLSSNGPMVADCLLQVHQSHRSSEKSSKIHSIEKYDLNALKKQKVSGEDNSDSISDAGNLPDLSENCFNGDRKGYDNYEISSRFFSDEFLRTTCENLKEKYLSVFSSKLFVAQQEFGKSYTQVCFLLAVP